MNQIIKQLTKFEITFTVTFTWFEDKKVFIKYYINTEHANPVEVNEMSYRRNERVFDCLVKSFEIETKEEGLIKWSY
jgi:hypothetical protein